MIEHLTVKNVALIERAEIHLHCGLNIITGETGAGKSILIDSINFALGQRPDRDFIRSGRDMASVDLMLMIDNPAVMAQLEEMGCEMEPDQLLLLSRTVNTQGKTVCRANGKAITLGMLREISGMVVDVHGQHAHQSLLDPSRHMLLLDRFCGELTETLKAQLAEAIRRYKEAAGKIHALSGNERDRNAKLEILSFQKNEIEAAKLQPNEDENLLERRKVLINAERLATGTYGALELLYGVDSEGLSASDQIGKSLQYAQEIAEMDPSQAHLAENLESITLLLEDTVRDLRRYADGLEHDSTELNATEQRLDLIYTLKRKYGATIADIVNHFRKVSDELETMENSEAMLQALNREKRKHTEDILLYCGKLSALRKKAAGEIKAAITEALRDLGMKNVQFDIEITRKKEFSPHGYDHVEFMISPNLGEPLKPLAKIASGGEMSRVMLALKTVLADSDTIGTFIFDEIDAGVSGRAAQKVAEKLVELSKNHQIVCITHLPQIASMADAHFLIEKRSIEAISESAAENNIGKESNQEKEGKTVTEIFPLNSETCIQELARLLGGAKITDATIKAAAEMKEMAKQIKRSFG